MPFITLSNLKRFLANLLSKNLVFKKSLIIAPNMYDEPGGITKIGSFTPRPSSPSLQIPQLAIQSCNHDKGDLGGVFYRGDEIATKRYADAAVGNETKRWKKAYNYLRERSYPTQFDNDELTALTSEPMNLQITTEISLSQPYTSFAGLLFEVTGGGDSNNEHFGLTHIYISTAELIARVQRIAAIFDETHPGGVPPSIELFCNGREFLYIEVDTNESTGTLGETPWAVTEGQGTIERIYGVRFKQIE